MLTNKDLKYIQSILKKHERGRSTPAESRFIENYFDYLDELNKNADPFSGLNTGSKFKLEQEIKSRLDQSIKQERGVVRNIAASRKFNFKWQAAAAIIFIIIGASAYWFFSDRDSHPSEKIVYITPDIPPGSDHATLKLGSGQEITLDSMQGSIVQNSNFVVDNNNGTLNYKGEARSVENHTLYTPKGGQYKLQLPDGTNVWLNASSSITYPTVFTGNERNVTITGEVYMEVTKDPSRPFYVQVNKMKVAVLGTSFNINAYDDEPYIKTTLLDGSVKVIAGRKMQMLVPGQQATVSGDSIQLFKNVSTAETIAWKNGFFKFENTDIEAVMRQLSRWYNIDVEYQEGNVKEYFIANIPRNVPISKILKLLELTGAVHFKIEKNKIIVTP